MFFCVCGSRGLTGHVILCPAIARYFLWLDCVTNSLHSMTFFLSYSHLLLSFFVIISMILHAPIATLSLSFNIPFPVCCLSVSISNFFSFSSSFSICLYYLSWSLSPFTFLYHSLSLFSLSISLLLLLCFFLSLHSINVSIALPSLSLPFCLFISPCWRSPSTQLSQSVNIHTMAFWAYPIFHFLE